jgi:hypothetical protein
VFLFIVSHYVGYQIQFQHVLVSSRSFVVTYFQKLLIWMFFDEIPYYVKDMTLRVSVNHTININSSLINSISK